MRFLHGRGCVLTLVASLSAIALVAVPNAGQALAAEYTHPTPQFVVRAGSTNDVYVLMEGPSFPWSNRVERSTNGGASFTDVGSLPIAARPTAGELAIDRLDFASADDGFAYGPDAHGNVADIYSTSDAGATWHTTHLAANQSISSMVATTSYVYLVVNQPHSLAKLERAPLSLSHWTVLPIPLPLSRYGSTTNVAAYGNLVWLSSMNQVRAPYSYVATSHDFGASFHVSGQPLLNSAAACGLTAVSTEVLWAECDQGNMAGQIAYSGDGGAHWVIKESNEVLSSFFFGAIDPVTSTLMFVANERYPRHLVRVANATSAATVTGTFPNGGRRLVEGLCFVNEKQGLLLTEGNGDAPYATLWRTDDGGRRWTKAFT